MSKKDNKAKLPSVFKMAANFAKDLTKYVKEGAPNVTHKQYVDRLAACKKCPHLIAPTMRCGKCGCMLEHKAKKKIASKEYKDKIRSWNKKITKAIDNGELKLEAKEDAKFAIYEDDLPREGYPFASLTAEDAERTREQLRKTNNSKNNKGDKKDI